MSVDLEWHRLDSSLAKALVDILNRQLVSVKRPSFIGPVEITSFDFGTVSPDVELVDLRDIHPDFLEDDSDLESEQDNVKVTEGAEGDDDGYEWVSRRASRRGLAEDALAYHHLPPHVRYGRSPATDLFMSTPTLYPGPPRDHWGSFPADGSKPSIPPRNSTTASDVSQSPNPPVSQQSQPDLQVHLHINWQSNLRLTLTTSLLINYPSPSFMSLPIKLSVTGIVFNSEVAVAFEGSRGRIHLCILDELDPYGPACRRSRSSQPSTPSDVDDEISGRRDGKPLPVGQRLLPSIFIESEIGQTDKHVLKNVTRVEKFIQDVIRKTVEEELVFPNFHTLVLADRTQ
ncbi:hypothetical protein BKA82DRAFT_123090 [Pisolithus tinctorius]|uniref:Mitochondrial distribution and morphology protein 12 n=1 Tax=Pisolithus tinctorius Marx 270 TaxID=870435 RepID=A0A0C3PHQ4_PISTI|nr:hypothetical protein BKA82DRAFT_123090 [Pisolithus tinctorius]KIO13580.1 hypothetical protein M404DRAFT_123090 [Pisolithus tinctorius Marx 270]